MERLAVRAALGSLSGRGRSCGLSPTAPPRRSHPASREPSTLSVAGPVDLLTLTKIRGSTSQV